MGTVSSWCLREILPDARWRQSIGGPTSAVQRRDGRSGEDWIGWGPRFSGRRTTSRRSSPKPSFCHLVPRHAARTSSSAVVVLTALAFVLGLQSVAPLFAQQSASQLARTLAAAKSWGYQLQDVDPEVIAASPYDMVVIDYSRDGTSETVFTPAELETMKKKPDGGRRIVLSYLSIGEAEKYRYYWKWYWGWFFGWFAPSWRDRQNKEWRGNYAVRYWDPGWQEIIVTGDEQLSRPHHQGGLRRRLARQGRRVRILREEAGRAAR